MRVSAHLGNLEALKKEAHRTFVQHLARRITEALDQMAGPRALSPEEQELQQVCREEFGVYDPSCDKQHWFARHLQALANATSTQSKLPVPHPPEPALAAVSDGGGDELMAVFLKRDPADRLHQSRRPVKSTPPPTVRRDHGRRTDWGHYLARWRGSAGGGSKGDDDGDPSRFRHSPGRGRSSCRLRPRMTQSPI